MNPSPWKGTFPFVRFAARRARDWRARNWRARNWRARHRQRLLALALVMALLAPFGLYGALQTGLAVLAVAFFGVIAASMVLALWAG